MKKQNKSCKTKHRTDSTGICPKNRCLRNTIATYETCERTPIDAIVRSLCHEFNINETWLRTGQGRYVYRNES